MNQKNIVRLLLMVALALVFLTVISSCSQEKEEDKYPSLQDTDQDGVLDLEDHCPETDISSFVGKSGCSSKQLYQIASLKISSLSNIERITESDKKLIRVVKEAIDTSLDPTLFVDDKLTCDTHAEFVAAQKAAMQALENLTCIVDATPLTNVSREGDRYYAIYHKQLAHVSIDAQEIDETETDEELLGRVFEKIVVDCPVVLEKEAGEILEYLLSAHLLQVKEAQEKSTCTEEKSKEGAQRNIALSLDNHKYNRFLTIQNNLDVAWRYAHMCDCGPVYPLMDPDGLLNASNVSAG